MTFSSPVPLGEVFAGKYRVDRVLGEGGMGVVVAAYHLELEQPVAVKFLLDDVAKNAEGAERFRREARAAAKIQSDHVVRVLDVGLLESGERFMVMEYLDGHDLAEELQKNGALPIDAAVRHVLEALDAITQAHASGIIHRDLKPANLYLARRPDGSRRIKVLDFGISKSLSQTTSEQLSLTRTSAWIGSPLYMAPEQMQSARDVDARADVWSLGAILYEAISGQPPYPAESLPQLCNLMLTRDPQPLIELRPEVAPELNAVVMKALSRDIAQRWQSSGELGAALAALSPALPGRASMRSFVGLAATDVITGQGSLAPMGGGLSNRSLTPQVTSNTAQGGQSMGAPANGAMPATTAQGVPQKTSAAWGGTSGGEQGSRRNLWLALSAAAVLGIGAVAFFARGQEPQVTPVVAGAESAPVAASAAVAPAAQAVAAPSAATDPAPAASVAPSAAPEASAAPSTPSTSSSSAAPVSAPVKKPAKPAAPKPVKSQPTDGLSDFGGRR